MDWPPGSVAWLPLCLKDSGKISCMAAVGLRFLYCNKGLWRSEALSWRPISSSNILKFCSGYKIPDGPHKQAGAMPLRSCRHNTDVTSPASDPAGCPLTYLSLGMTEPES